MDYRKQWEQYHGIKIPKGWHVHHITYRSNGGTDAMNNLWAMPVKLHKKIHRGESYERMIASGTPKANSLKGEDRTDNQRAGSEASSIKQKGRVFSDKHIAALISNHIDVRGDKNPMFGRPSPMSNPKWLCTCVYCNKTMSKGNYTRWHDDNCKHKGDNYATST